jgi:hypothetical protein
MRRTSSGRRPMYSPFSAEITTIVNGSNTHEWANSLQVFERNGGDDGTRTRGLCRDRAAF